MWLYNGALWLALLSPTAAVLVILSLVGLLAAVLYEYRDENRKTVLWVRDATVEALAWVFMVLGLDRWRVKHTAFDQNGGDKVYEEDEAAWNSANEKREQYERAMEELRVASPEAFASGQPNSDSWFANVIQRMRDRSRQKDREEKIQLVEQARRFYAAWHGAATEYAASVEASDNAKWVQERIESGASRKEKMEDAKIRELERKRKISQLEQEVKETELSDEKKLQRRLSQLHFDSVEKGRRHADNAHEAQEFMTRCEAVRKEIQKAMEDTTVSEKAGKHFLRVLDKYMRQGVNNLLQGKGLNDLNIYEEEP